MTRTASEIAAAVAAVKIGVRSDQAAGIVPANVTTFSALHDYVDANTYAGFCTPGHRDDWSTDDLITVQEAVQEWLEATAPVGKLTLTMTVSVDAEDYADFLREHADNKANVVHSFDARLDEVYGPDVAVLTTANVEAITMNFREA